MTDYNITKRTIIDTVPKAIMLSLVSHSKEDLQKELLAELYVPQAMEELLKVRYIIIFVTNADAGNKGERSCRY